MYKQLKDAMDSLYKRRCHYVDINDTTKRRRNNKIRWVTKSRSVDIPDCIQVIFSKKIVENIARVERKFTKYSLENISRMTSVHAIRMYQLLVQYKGIGRREITLEWLRNALQLEDTHKLTADFTKKVLDIAVSQINKHSNLSVNYTSKKTGRAITSFIFKIKDKSTLKKIGAGGQTAPIPFEDFAAENAVAF